MCVIRNFLAVTDCYHRMVGRSHIHTYGDGVVLWVGIERYHWTKLDKLCIDCWEHVSCKMRRRVKVMHKM